MSGFPPRGPEGRVPRRSAPATRRSCRPPASTSKVLTVDELFELARVVRTRPTTRWSARSWPAWSSTRGPASGRRSGRWRRRRAGAAPASPTWASSRRPASPSSPPRSRCDILGPDGLLWDPDGPRDGRYAEALVFAAASSIYGGTDQIQRNVIGERALGLPREPDPNKGLPFREVLERTSLRRNLRRR